MEINLTHLIAFVLGFIAAAGKDLLQVFIISRHMKKLGQMDYSDEMDKMMKATSQLNDSFAPNTPEDDSGLETNYKGYFS